MITVREFVQRARGRAGALALDLTRRPRRPTPRAEAQLRAALRQTAATITCRGDGLDLIRTRTNGAPLPGDAAATTTDDDLGSQTP